MANSESADLMAIGGRCSVASCGQQDFLPFKCSGCGDTFCLDHRTFESHACPRTLDAADATVVVCPLCAKAIKLAPGRSGDQAFDEHTRSGACDPSNYSRVHRKKSCPVRGCREKLTTLSRYQCKRCGLEVCMSHRLPGDHGCDDRIAQARRTVSSHWSAMRAASFGRAEASKPSAVGTSSTPISQWPTKLAQYVNPASNQSRVVQQQKREVCRHCGARFSQVQQLTQHLRDYHPTQDSRQDRDICPRCGQQFTDVVALVQHTERGCRDPKRSGCILV
ncbi:unnamed protein product [Ostreobium quekettii]|uniref:Zinc finger protein n=1 Tax=Ostreobium quekettii TaxID=121088 RepID=A0A8S1IM21_9CHLO|nr:unnamed protein product [Ostreobium quekettii]